METPDLVLYGDGYYQRTIYGLGPYIADYPEQVLLACIVQGWCPRCVLRAELNPKQHHLLYTRCTAPQNNLDDGAGRR